MNILLVLLLPQHSRPSHKNYLLVGDVGIAKHFSKKYGNKERAFNYLGVHIAGKTPLFNVFILINSIHILEFKPRCLLNFEKKSMNTIRHTSKGSKMDTRLRTTVLTSLLFE